MSRANTSPEVGSNVSNSGPVGPATKSPPRATPETNPPKGSPNADRISRTWTCLADVEGMVPSSIGSLLDVVSRPDAGLPFIVRSLARPSEKRTSLADAERPGHRGDCKTRARVGAHPNQQRFHVVVHVAIRAHPGHRKQRN